MAELTLHLHQDYEMRCASLRYFTAYGERCLENHDVIAMIGRVHQTGSVHRMGHR